MSSLTNFKLFSEIILKLLPAMTVVDLIAKTHYRFMLMLYSAPCGNIFVLHYILRIIQSVKTARNVCIHVLACVYFGP